jgi:hypothetical protein
LRSIEQEMAIHGVGDDFSILEPHGFPCGTVKSNRDVTTLLPRPGVVGADLPASMPPQRSPYFWVAYHLVKPDAGLTVEAPSPFHEDGR